MIFFVFYSNVYFVNIQFDKRFFWNHFMVKELLTSEVSNSV